MNLVMQTWLTAVDTLGTSSASSCSLYLNKATIGGVPTTASRHNTPSRSHALYKLVQCAKKNEPVVAIIVSVRFTLKFELIA